VDETSHNILVRWIPAVKLFFKVTQGHLKFSSYHNLISC